MACPQALVVRTDWFEGRPGKADHFGPRDFETLRRETVKESTNLGLGVLLKKRHTRLSGTQGDPNARKYL